jgi:hypothetical protein
MPETHSSALELRRTRFFMNYKTIWLAVTAAAALMAPALTWAAEPDSWFERQTLNPATMQRLSVGWSSCCLGSEVVKTQFRVDKTTYGDEWYYIKDGAWKRVPEDTIHWGKHAPGGQATLFIYFMTGEETCFYPPQEGI